MAFALIDGLVLHYNVQGRADAPVLALVNSLGTDARIWDVVIALLAPHYCIVSYDKRGHGLSDAPTGDHTIAQHTGDLVGLLDHLGIARVALAGVSVGGLIAQDFAVRYPQRLTALVLCDTAAQIGTDAIWNARIAAVRGPGLASIVEPVMERWFTPSYRQQRPVDLAGWSNMFLRMPAEGYAGTCAALRDADLTEAVAGIAAPTLVLVGDQDLSTPPELVRATAERIPKARFQTIAGAGHLPMIEQPEVLVAALQQFFNEVGHG
ncbi:MAG TPA: 3-oxoadipate enol-lactonase [Devosia sp.]|nr:3-oxoadipate enol-lactonase [Devosia sp.]